MTEPAAELRFIVPPAQDAGAYANALAPWFSVHEFTLDFGVTLPPVRDDDGSTDIVPCLVVSRVKVPVTMIFDMLQAINGIMTQYEEQFGSIKRIGEDELQ